MARLAAVRSLERARFARAWLALRGTFGEGELATRARNALCLEFFVLVLARRAWFAFALDRVLPSSARVSQAVDGASLSFRACSLRTRHTVASDFASIRVEGILRTTLASAARYKPLTRRAVVWYAFIRTERRGAEAISAWRAFALSNAIRESIERARAAAFCVLELSGGADAGSARR